MLFAALTATVRSYYNEKPGHLNSLLEDAVVDEVLTANGVSSRLSIKAEMANIDAHLFFIKVSLGPLTNPKSQGFTHEGLIRSRTCLREGRQQLRNRRPF
jgi:hypothetical protein